jgi:hypothetical protein
VFHTQDNARKMGVNVRIALYAVLALIVQLCCAPSALAQCPGHDSVG